MPKVTAFLAALAQSGRVADAARAVGMSRQAAYRLRARLKGTRFEAAFEGARRQGIHARFAASVARNRSIWDGPGLAEMLRTLRAQDDAMAVQGDAARPQGDAPPAQGHTVHEQGDASPRKATKHPLDCVTSVT